MLKQNVVKLFPFLPPPCQGPTERPEQDFFPREMHPDAIGENPEQFAQRVPVHRGAGTTYRGALAPAGTYDVLDHVKLIPNPLVLPLEERHRIHEGARPRISTKERHPSDLPRTRCHGELLTGVG